MGYTLLQRHHHSSTMNGGKRGLLRTTPPVRYAKRFLLSRGSCASKVVTTFALFACLAIVNSLLGRWIWTLPDPETPIEAVYPKWKWAEPKKNCVFVYHLPKAGGTTMRQHFQMMAEWLNWTVMNWEYLRPEDIPTDPFDGYMHLGHNVPPIDIDACIKFTQLRNPVDRAISEWFAVKRDDYSVERFQDAIRNKRLGKIRFINNVVTSYAFYTPIIGVEPENPAQRGSVTEEEFEKAQEVLLSYEGVCFLEDDPAGCLQRFAHDHLGLNYPVKADRVVGKTLTKKQFPNEVVSELADLNEEDLRFYRWARRSVSR